MRKGKNPEAKPHLKCEGLGDLARWKRVRKGGNSRAQRQRKGSLHEPLQAFNLMEELLAGMKGV